MKVGKEGIVGTIAALEAWEKRDHAGDPRTRDAAISSSGTQTLAGRPGVTADPSSPTRPTTRSTGSRSRSIRPPRTSRPGIWPMRSQPDDRRSSCATTRSSMATSISTPATSTPGEETDRRSAARRGTGQGATVQRDHRDPAGTPPQPPRRVRCSSGRIEERERRLGLCPQPPQVARPGDHALVRSSTAGRTRWARGSPRPRWRTRRTRCRSRARA